MTVVLLIEHSVSNWTVCYRVLDFYLVGCIVPFILLFKE